MKRLLVSIVTYRPERALLLEVFAALRRELEGIPSFRVVVVDNGAEEAVARLCRRFGYEWLPRQDNPGYGRGHNAVEGEADFRLILNPDAVLLPGSLKVALSFLDSHPEVGIVVPAVREEDGTFRPLCKRYPSLSVLFLRGLVPPRLRRPFAPLLDRYEMRDLDWRRPRRVEGVASGCCFLIREEVWERLGGFDPGYFLYFEDFDLFLRARAITQVFALPDFRIVHYGGGAAKKGWRHRFWFAHSAWRFFRRHGWRWL